MARQLLSTQNYVEAPFIIVTIGEYTFGKFIEKGTTSPGYVEYEVTFPNYVNELNIKKINGTVNIYTLKLTYPITPNQDPNLMERVFSSVSSSRRMKLTYGDCNSPSFVFREESCIITKVSSSLSFSGSNITYTVNATSDSGLLTAGKYDFPAITGKPSDIIKSYIKDKRYGITDIFTGMSNYQKVLDAHIIADNDKAVSIQAKTQISILEYITYLVNCMVSLDDSGDGVIKSSQYYISVVDDLTDDLGGTYFKITQVDLGTSKINSLTTYEITIGYPEDNYVSDFSFKNDQSWAMIYNYNEKIQQPNYVYKIDDNGKIVTDYAPNITIKDGNVQMTSADRTWWTQMTQFPIQATITIRGLLRPAILMSYVKLNILFYGMRHVSSGIYIITEQNDTISGSGYKTKLSLTRVGGDEL